jgi:hypothetical protein
VFIIIILHNLHVVRKTIRDILAPVAKRLAVNMAFQPPSLWGDAPNFSDTLGASPFES